MRGPDEVIVVVHRRSLSEPEFLILRRTLERQGYWSIVAGGVEEGETPAEAAARELIEEVGLEPESGLSELGLALEYDIAGEPPEVLARFAPSVESVTLHAFAAEAPVGWEPTLDAEHDDYRWCGLDEAVASMFYEAPRKALQETARRLEAPW